MADMTIPTLADIEDAARIIEGAVVRTPFLAAPKLSALTRASISVKYENLQVTNAFKERGALVKLNGLTAGEKRRGIIAMSAGNHAQAVARHAARLDIPATIVMPEATPFVKVDATRSYGADVVLHGDSLDEAHAEAERLCTARDLVWVHPYDDFDVIRGQGTIALEMLTDDPTIDTLVVPIGGGGLISGMAIAAKAINPGITVIGVEAALYPSMWCALKGEPPRGGGLTLAEGIAVKTAGKLTRKIAAEFVDDILLVNESSLERAVNAFLTRQKTMAEGAGAAGLAALLAAPDRFAGRHVGLVLCGGNIDPRVLASIMVRELARDHRIVAIRAVTMDQPGVLGDIATLIGRHGGNILGVSHNRLFLDVPAKGASVDMTFETRDAAHAAEIITSLEAAGHEVRLLDVAEAMI